MFIDDILHLDNEIDDFLDRHDRLQPVILFGAGFALERTILKLEKNGFNIACIGDNDARKHGNFWGGRYEILSLKSCIEKFPSALYLITSPLYFWEISENLKQHIPTDLISTVDFECSHYFSGREFKGFFIQNIQRFESLYARFDDEVSRKTLHGIAKAHFSGNRRDFEAACTESFDWYLFKSLLQPGPEDVYVDCGAYDGDTVLLFHNSACNGYKSILAFEPDETIHSLLNETISKNNIKNCKVINKGAYSRNGTLLFSQSGVYSSVPSSNQSVQPQLNTVEIGVTTIDSVLDGAPVHIIKMDIEGAEVEALKGAETSIRKFKPRLAICLYHNIHDFIEIPELILKMVPDYRLYLRHHSKSCTDTILYAAPTMTP